MTVKPTSERDASCAGVASCSTSPTARLPPAPDSVTDVAEAVVFTMVPSAVVEPPLTLFKVNVAEAVVLVPANATVPARLAGIVSAIAQGTLMTPDAAGFPANGNVTGTLCTELGIWENVTLAPAILNAITHAAP